MRVPVIAMTINEPSDLSNATKIVKLEAGSRTGASVRVERYLLVDDDYQVTSSFWRPHNTSWKVKILSALVDHRKLLSGTEPDNIWRLISIEFQSVRTAPEFNVCDAVDHCALLRLDLTDLQHVFWAASDHQIHGTISHVGWRLPAIQRHMQRTSGGPSYEPWGSLQSRSVTLDSTLSVQNQWRRI